MNEIHETASECPTPAQATPLTVQTQTLHRACEKVGGIEQLAALLRVSTVLLTSWLEGTSATPRHIFLAAVDIALS
jgi:hypothetical protein